jgi:hypothetical protein
MAGYFTVDGGLREIITVDGAVRLYHALTGGRISKAALLDYVTCAYRHLGIFYYLDADLSICEGIRQKPFIYFVKTRQNLLKTNVPGVIFGDEHI